MNEESGTSSGWYDGRPQSESTWVIRKLHIPQKPVNKFISPLCKARRVEPFRMILAALLISGMSAGGRGSRNSYGDSGNT